MFDKAFALSNDENITRDMINEAFIRIINNYDKVVTLNKFQMATYFVSTINSVTICLLYTSDIEKRGYTFKYMLQENQGAAAAVNQGLKIMTGEFFQLFDIDDILYPDNVSKKVKVFDENSNVGIVINNGYFFNIDSGKRTVFRLSLIHI